MGATVLIPRDLPSLPLEADGLTPDAVLGRAEREVATLPMHVGNAAAELGELFRVKGAGSEEILIEGDVARVSGIGTGMTRGRIVIEGNAGPHTGARMRGGELIVRGDAGDYSGAEMAGGVLRIGGDAGDGVGAAYPGALRGMTNGAILVDGDAGRSLGATLRRGTIAVRGSAGDDAGFGMIAGTLVLLGGARRRPGAGMKRGSVVLGRDVDLLPTFRYVGIYRLTVLVLLLRALRGTYGFDVEERYLDGRYRRYSGDFVELGRGEVWVWNP
ncbi:MAG: formylmethanofuran dehydrogenase subunit C [Gemmatimonadota bacterium]